MHTLLSLFLVFFSLPSFGFSPISAEQGLLNGITLCPTESNPMTALKELRGDLFHGATIDYDLANRSYTVTAFIVRSPSAKNLAIMAPDVLVGKLVLRMYYRRSGAFDRPLVCELKTGPVY